jgi:anti-sigma factor RsiW
MTTRTDGFDEDDLLAHLRGTAAPETSARIDAAAEADPAFRAELAVARGLKDALASATEGPDQRPFGWKRLEAEIGAQERTAVAPPQRTALWRIAALFLGAVVLGQSAYIALGPGVGDAPLYQTVSEEAPDFGLAVAFTPNAQIAVIETLLRDSGARIVDGPSALGLYRLAFEDAAALDAARSALNTSPIVDLVAED